MAEKRKKPEVSMVDEGLENRSQANLEPSSQSQDTIPTEKQQDMKSVIYGTEKNPGRQGPIDKAAIVKAEQILRDYRNAKQMLDRKIVESEEWWRLRHWETVGKTEGKEDEEEPNSAWLFNSLANKHADFMDNAPAPNFLPREESDAEDAELLQAIVPCIMDANKFSGIYSDACWTKMKHGTSVYGVFWNSAKENGLGDIDVVEADIKNLYWEPGIKDIQKSQHFFNLERQDAAALIDAFPFLDGKISGGYDGTMTYYHQDENDVDRNATEDKKVTVVDWYYKKQNKNGKLVVHYVKYVEDQLIYASENDKRYAEDGYYDHGKYPFVFDVLFPTSSSPVGFGYIDVMKSPQLYIDKLDQIILTNAALSGKKRWFVKDGSDINEDEYADWSKDFVHVAGGNLDDNLREIQVSPVPNFIQAHHQSKIDELKETSGNRDFSQGSTQSGVTAASAIAALQEAGSKLSRDMIHTSYRAYSDVCELVMELIRQFYDEERAFRIDKPNGGYEFIRYSNAGIIDQGAVDPVTGEWMSRRPVFDIKISAQKQSPFNRTAQNELAKELFGMGVFNPQMATQVLPMLQMMEFEGIEKIRETVRNNGTLQELFMQLQQLAVSMAQQLDTITGGQTQFVPAVSQIIQQAGGEPILMGSAQTGSGQPMVGSDGLPATDNTMASKARVRAANLTNPDVSR